MRLLLVLVISVSMFSLSFTGKEKTETITPVEGTGIGNVAPNLTFKNPQGEEISLYDLRGKLVLIDFWASWCRPCRYENPHVVKAYEEFHDKKFTNGDGFEIFNVSLDKTKEAWVAAIKQDGLVWENHICDFGGWRSALSAKYGVSSIPANFLIDKDGIIIAKGLRGPALKITLENMLAKAD